MPQTFWFCTGQRSKTTARLAHEEDISCKAANIYTTNEERLSQINHRQSQRAGGRWRKAFSRRTSIRSQRRLGFTKHGRIIPTVRIFQKFSEGKILHEPTDIYNVIITWRFPDQSRPQWQQKGFISHLRDCQSSSLWLLLEGRLVRGEQSRCTSAAARWPPCALQPRWCCQVEAPCQTLHREELFLKPSSRCATGGDLGAVLGWGSLHQTGRLWGTNADLKINKQIRGVYIRVLNFQKGARKLDKRGHVFPQNCRHLRVNEESHKE